MGISYSVKHASILAVNLPSDSRIMKEINPSNAWNWTEYLLSLIEYNTRISWWAKTKDGAKNKKKPKPIKPPSKTTTSTTAENKNKGKINKIQSVRLDRAQFDKIMNYTQTKQGLS
jgi:hypothetical protein